jgi:NAD(P)-dependent dehydrogenase (short-subunit alcohol dehydrogenase family)
MTTEAALSAEPGLNGRHAIVTGGSRGIGAAIAQALAADGATLTLLGRARDRLQETSESLASRYGVTVAAIVCDVTDEAAVRAAFAAAQDAHGAAFALINNAGQSEGAPFLQTGRELWERMLAVNLTAAYLCAQQVLPAMLAAGSGRIINIASTSALRGFRNISAYTAAKHGLLGLTRALAAETVRKGITVNAVCPAYTATDMAEAAVGSVVRDMQRTPEEARAMIARTVQRGTLIEPHEVASAVSWLCSAGASGITGQAIVVAGGEI